MLLLFLFFLSFCASAVFGMNPTGRFVKKITSKVGKEFSTLSSDRKQDEETGGIKPFSSNNTKKNNISVTKFSNKESFFKPKTPISGDLKEVLPKIFEGNELIPSSSSFLDIETLFHNETKVICSDSEKSTIIQQVPLLVEPQLLQQEIKTLQEKIVGLEKREKALKLNSDRLQNKLDNAKDGRYQVDLNIAKKEYEIEQLKKNLLVSTEQNQKLINQQQKFMQQENNSQQVIEEIALHNLGLQNGIETIEQEKAKIEHEKKFLVEELNKIEQKFKQVQLDGSKQATEFQEQKKIYENLLETMQARVKRIELERNNDKIRFSDEQEKLKKVLWDEYQQVVHKIHEEHKNDKEKLKSELDKVKIDYEIASKNQLSELTKQFAEKERGFNEKQEQASLEQQELLQKIRLLEQQRISDAKQIFDVQGEKTQAREQLTIVNKKLETVQVQIEYYKQDAKGLQNQINTKNQAIKHLEQKLKEVEQELEKTSKDNGLLSDNLGSVLTQSEQSVTLLKQDKDGLLQRLNFQQEENKDLKKQLASSHKSFEIKKDEALEITRQLKEERGKLKDAYQAVDKLMGDMENLLNKLSWLQKEHNLLSKKFSGAESTLEQKEKMVDDLKQQCDESQKNLQEALHSVSELQKQISSYKKFKEDVVPTLIKQETSKLKKEYELKLFERDERVDTLTQNNDKHIVDIENIQKEKESLQKQLGEVPEKIRFAVQQATNLADEKYQKRVLSLQEQHELELKGLREDSERDLRVLQEEHKQKIEKIKEIYKKAKEEILNISKQQIDKLNNDTQEQQKDYKVKLKELEEQHKKMLQDHDVSSKKKEQKLISFYDQRVLDLENSHKKDKELLITAITTEFEKQRVLLTNNIQEKDKLLQEFTQKIDEQKQEIKKLQEVHNQDVNTIKSLEDACTKSVTRINELTSNIQQLGSENHTLKLEAKKLEEMRLRDKEKFDLELNSEAARYKNELVNLGNQSLLDKKDAQNQLTQLTQQYNVETIKLKEKWHEKEQEYKQQVEQLTVQQKSNEQELSQLKNKYECEIKTAQEIIQNQNIKLTQAHNNIKQQTEQNLSLQKEIESLEKRQIDMQNANKQEKEELELKITNAKNALGEAQKTFAQQLHDFEREKSNYEASIKILSETLTQARTELAEKGQAILEKNKLLQEFTQKIDEQKQEIERFQKVHNQDVNTIKSLEETCTQKVASIKSLEFAVKELQNKNNNLELEAKKLEERWLCDKKEFENKLVERENQSLLDKEEAQNKLTQLTQQYNVETKKLEEKWRKKEQEYNDQLELLKVEKKSNEQKLLTLQEEIKSYQKELQEEKYKSEMNANNYQESLQEKSKFINEQLQEIELLQKNYHQTLGDVEDHKKVIAQQKTELKQEKQIFEEKILNLQRNQEQVVSNLVNERDQNLYDLKDIYQKEVNKVLKDAKNELNEQRRDLEGTITKLRERVGELLKQEELTHDEIASLKQLLEKNKKTFEWLGASRLELVLNNEGLRRNLQWQEKENIKLQKSYEQEIAKTTQELERMENILKELEKKLSNQKEDGIQKTGMIFKLEQSNKELLRQLQEATGNYEQAQQKILDYEQKIIDMAQEFNKQDVQAHRAISNLIENSEILKEEIRKLKHQKNEQNKINKKTQLKNLTTAAKELNKIQEGLKFQQNTINTQRDTINQLQKEKQLLEANSQKQQENNKNLLSTTTQQNQNIERLTQEVTDIGNQMQELTKKLSETELRQRIERGDFYVEKNQDLITIEKLKKELEKAHENYQKINSELQNVCDDKKQGQEKLKTLGDSIKNLELQREQLTKKLDEQDQEYQKINVEKEFTEHEAKKLKEDSKKTFETLNKFASSFEASMQNFETKVDEKLTAMNSRVDMNQSKLNTIKGETEIKNKKLQEQKMLIEKGNKTIEKYDKQINDLTQKVKEFEQSWRESIQKNKKLLDEKKRQQENGSIVFKIPVPMTDKKKKQKINVGIAKKDSQITKLKQEITGLKQELKVIKNQKKVLGDEQKTKIEELERVITSLQGRVREQTSSNIVLEKQKQQVVSELTEEVVKNSNLTNLAEQQKHEITKQTNTIKNLESDVATWQEETAKKNDAILKLGLKHVFDTNSQKNRFYLLSLTANDHIKRLIRKLGKKEKRINQFEELFATQDKIIKNMLKQQTIKQQKEEARNLIQSNLYELQKKHSFINCDKENIKEFLTPESLNPLRKIVDNYKKTKKSDPSDPFDKYFFLPLLSQVVSPQK